MWNSKSCPEGLPHQKNGAIASRQVPAKTVPAKIEVREIGLLSNRDAPSWRPTQAQSQKVILVHGKILGKLIEAKSFSGEREVFCVQRGGTDRRELGRRQRRGRRFGFRFFCEARFLELADGSRIPLTMHFGEKLFFVQRIT